MTAHAPAYEGAGRERTMDRAGTATRPRRSLSYGEPTILICAVRDRAAHDDVEDSDEFVGEFLRDRGRVYVVTRPARRAGGGMGARGVHLATCGGWRRAFARRLFGRSYKRPHGPEPGRCPDARFVLLRWSHARSGGVPLAMCTTTSSEGPNHTPVSGTHRDIAWSTTTLGSPRSRCATERQTPGPHGP
jgi:hypothetical protein